MSGKHPNLSIEEVARRYNYSVEELKVMADEMKLPHIKRFDTPGQVKFLFPADELARKLAPRPAGPTVPAAPSRVEDEEDVPVEAIYPKPRSVESKAPKVEEEPKPATKKKSSTKKSK